MHHGCQDGAVHLVEWVHRVLTADDGHVPDPDHVVTVANVTPSLGGYLVGELRAAGIDAQLRDRYPVYGGTLRSEILCFEPDHDRAVEIIDAALAEQRG
jgi:hypothetical protein